MQMAIATIMRNINREYNTINKRICTESKNYKYMVYGNQHYNYSQALNGHKVEYPN